MCRTMSRSCEATGQGSPPGPAAPHHVRTRSRLVRPFRLVGLLDPPPGRGHEDILERGPAVPCRKLARRPFRYGAALMQDPDPVGEPRGFVEIVRGEQDRGVMRVTKIAHERLHLALASDVESRRGL